MRKLILSLVFVLATGSTFMNATSSNKETLKNYETPDCWAAADMYETAHSQLMDCEGIDMTYEQSHDVWASAYDTCMG
tara:strand:+ start:966 stop:1199 length:234 start_codon:yes stop_codon:yes gene_type:complete